MAPNSSALQSYNTVKLCSFEVDYPDGTIMHGGQVISLEVHSSTSLVKEDEFI